MPLPRFALNYRRCSVLELRTFLAQRGLQVKGEGTCLTRTNYIEALEAADETATFRFLNLPTEVRLGVYRELRHIDGDMPGKYTRWPQILRTSQEINKEATEVLYARLDICFSLSSPLWKDNHDFVINIDGVEQAFESTFRWPERFRRAHSLRVIFDMIGMDAGAGAGLQRLMFDLVQRCFYSLCCFLAPDHQLRTIDARFHLPHDSRTYEDIKYLWPIAKLRIPSNCVRIRGISDEVIEGSLGVISTSNAPNADVFHEAQDAVNRAGRFTSGRDYFDVRAPSHGPHIFSPNNRELLMHAQVLAGQVHDLLYEQSKMYTGEEDEQDLVDATTRLKQCVKDICDRDIQDIEDKLSALRNVRARLQRDL